MSFHTYDTSDDIILSFEIKEKLLFPETVFWHDVMVMVGRVRSTPAHAVDNLVVKGGCFLFPSNQNTCANLNFVLIKKI